MLVVAFVVAMAGLPGCQSCQVSSDPPPQALPSAEELMTKIDGLRDTLPATLTTYAKAEYFGPEIIHKGKAILAAERPDKFYMEAMTATDQMVSALSTDGTSFVGYEVGNQSCYTGQPCAENLAKITPIYLPPEDAVATFFGLPVVLEHSSAEVAHNPDMATVDLILRQGEAVVERIHFAPDTLQVAGCTLYRPDGEIEATVTFADHAQVGDVAIPTTLTLSFPARGIEVGLVYLDPTFGKELKGSLFTKECPAGMAPIEMYCIDPGLPQAPEPDGQDEPKEVP